MSLILVNTHILDSTSFDLGSGSSATTEQSLKASQVIERSTWDWLILLPTGMIGPNYVMTDAEHHYSLVPFSVLPINKGGNMLFNFFLFSFSAATSSQWPVKVRWFSW
jgi:hypothetical protein